MVVEILSNSQRIPLAEASPTLSLSRARSPGLSISLAELRGGETQSLK